LPERLIPILRGFVNIYAVVAETVAVVDAGLPGRAGEVIAAVERLGRTAGDLRTIAMTHHHIDHSGALASLQRKTGALVYATALEAAILEGDAPVPKLVSASRGWSVLLAIAEHLAPTVPHPTQVHHRLADGERIELAGLTAVLTPGHTMGHVSYLHPASGLCSWATPRRCRHEAAWPFLLQDTTRTRWRPWPASRSSPTSNSTSHVSRTAAR
jgi:glyoxylase-like metal-dependent hydrolase (beta-lactamase superfamily II)